MKIHPQVINSRQRQVLRQMGRALTPAGFYLAGGTALALMLGHRRSVDLDWFIGEPIRDPLLTAQRLRDQGIPIQTTSVARGTLHGKVSGVAVSLLEYRFPRLSDLVPYKAADCRLASIPDLAAMKLAAVVQRGAKKDFVDLYTIASKQPLRDLLEHYRKKYSVAEVGHVLVGMSYFADADRDPMPTMLCDVDWRRIKRTINGWVREIAG